MLLDMRRHLDPVWELDLAPIGEGFKREEFNDWWARVGHRRLSHLDSRIAEQWIHRHWTGTLYPHLPLDRLTWKLESWSTEIILQRANASPNCRLDGDPELELKVFKSDYEPRKSFDATGTWNIPILMIHAPNGVLTSEGPREEVFYWLIEGHQRTRLLNALHSKGTCAANHEVFVVSVID